MKFKNCIIKTDVDTIAAYMATISALMVIEIKRTPS
jgi:hypothetical protein